MHDIYDCVESFIPLLGTEYELVLGRKGKAVTLSVTFDKKDCFHLMGLQYLTDRPELSKDRGKIFDAIKERRITKEQIESSDMYGKIAKRVHLLPLLEEVFDSNDTVFKYNIKINSFSLIQADYLMKNKILTETVFLFLARNKEGDYFCRSFFPQESIDYSKKQTSWTLLYKKKKYLLTGEETVLYDRLDKKK